MTCSWHAVLYHQQASNSLPWMTRHGQREAHCRGNNEEPLMTCSWHAVLYHQQASNSLPWMTRGKHTVEETMRNHWWPALDMLFYITSRPYSWPTCQTLNKTVIHNSMPNNYLSNMICYLIKFHFCWNVCWRNFQT